LAVALLTDGKVSEAIEHLVEALRILPSYTDAYFTLGRAYLQQGKLEEAVAQLEHVASFDREYKGLDDQLGRAYARQGEVKKAVRHFTLAVRHDPLRFESRYALGTSLAKYGNHPAAAAQFTEAVRIEPESPDAHLQLAQTQARMGQVEKAITHFEAALSLRPEWPEALNNLAWLLATSPDPKLRDPERALDLARQAKALADYKMPLVLDTLAAAQAGVGDFDQAEQNATQAAQMATDTEQPQLVEKIQRRLDSYRNGQPHVENADDHRQSAAE
jgi:tetratricopeptide (TPR) repeat protein